METEYNNYIITDDGKVYRYGKLKKIRLHNGRYDIKISINGKAKIYPLARLIYATFNPDFDISDKNQCITFKDNDKMNCNLNNLICVFRGDLIQGEGHRNRIKLTDKQIKSIKNEYNRTIDNKPINQYDTDKKEYNSYRSLAEKYNVTYPEIKMIIKGQCRNPKEYKLKK